MHIYHLTCLIVLISVFISPIVKTEIICGPWIKLWKAIQTITWRRWKVDISPSIWKKWHKKETGKNGTKSKIGTGFFFVRTSLKEANNDDNQLTEWIAGNMSLIEGMAEFRNRDSNPTLADIVQNRKHLNISQLTRDSWRVDLASYFGFCSLLIVKCQ